MLADLRDGWLSNACRHLSSLRFHWEPAPQRAGIDPGRLAQLTVGVIIEQELLAGPFVEYHHLVGAAATVRDDGMLADAELAKRLVLEWVGLEDVPQRIEAVGDQAFKIEGDLGSTIVEPAQLRRAAAGPEAVGGHPRRQAFLEVHLLLREQRDDEGLARLRGM